MRDRSASSAFANASSLRTEGARTRCAQASGFSSERANVCFERKPRGRHAFLVERVEKADAAGEELTPLDSRMVWPLFSLVLIGRGMGETS
ncbi:MAG: hypothetical protein C4334_07565 [Pyrinomonas sp.]